MVIDVHAHAMLPGVEALLAGDPRAERILLGLDFPFDMGCEDPVSAVGTVLMTRITVTGGYASDVLPMMLVFVTGNGAAMMSLTLLGTLNVGGRDAGLASGLIITSKQIGAAIWLAVLTTLDAAHAPGPGRSALVSGSGWASGSSRRCRWRPRWSWRRGCAAATLPASTSSPTFRPRAPRVW